MFRYTRLGLAPRQFVRFQSTKNDPISILSNMSKEDIYKEKMKSKDQQNSLFAFLGQPTPNGIQRDAYEYAKELPMPAKTASRSIICDGANLQSVRKIDRLQKANSIRQISFSQKYYVKPSKRKLQKRIYIKKQKFNKGISELLGAVKTAVRKGY